MNGCQRVLKAEVFRWLVCFALVAIASVAVATPVQQGMARNPNQLVQKSVLAPNGSRYFCESLSSTIQVLDQGLVTVAELQVTDEAGQRLSISGLEFDRTLNQLVAISSQQLYTINTATGVATAIATPTYAGRPQAYGKIEARQAQRAQRAQVEPIVRPVDESNPESVRAHEAYTRWLQTGTATAEEKQLIAQYVFPESRNDGANRGLDAIAGPDASDYYYVDSNEPFGATYDWIELCGDPLATTILSNVDDQTAEIFWANTFNFYGTGYTSAFVSSNGLITFDGADATFSNRCPYASVETGQPELAVYWDDLRPSVEGGCNGDGTAPWVLYRDFGDHVVVEWSQVPQFSDGSARVTFEAILYPGTGQIKYQYNSMSLPNLANLASVGIDAPGAGNGLEYGVCNNTTLPDGTSGLAVLFHQALLPPPLLCDCPVFGDNLFNSGDLNFAIIDILGSDFCSAVGHIEHTITVPPGAGNVVDINVIVNLTHTFYPDLVMDITHNGTTVLLTSQGGGGVGCGAQTWIFDDSGIPWASDCDYNGCVQPGSDPLWACATTTDLNAFNGMNASGNWTFRLVDRTSFDNGMLFNWGLCLTTTPPGHVSVDFDFPDFHCIDGALSPNPAPFVVHVSNPGPGDCHGVQINIGAGAGTGGSATVSTSPLVIGDLPAGTAVDVAVSLDITPSGSNGFIPLSMFVQSNDCGSYFIDFIRMDVPGCLPTPGDCNCMDVALLIDVTGSMGGAIANVVAELPNVLSTANTASGGDVRFAVFSFSDEVIPNLDFTFDQAAAQSVISFLSAAGGAAEPEASDEALREVITDDAACVTWETTGSFRGGCTKIAVLITDARPGGCDDIFDAGDIANAQQRANDALAADIRIAAVYVPTFPAYSPEIVPVMLNYADVSNGSYVEVNWDGQGTGNAISTVIENCGGYFPDDCLPEGPDCNGGQPAVYTTVSGAIDDAVLRITPAGEIELVWEPVDGAEFYQVYTSSSMEAEQNWSPVAFSLGTSATLPPMESRPDEPILFHVKGMAAAQTLVASDIACWPLDEGSGDLAEDFALDNDGTIVGADWVVGPSGHECLHFGYGDYVSVPNSTDFYGQPLQLDACVSIDYLPTYQTGAFYIFSCHRYGLWEEGFGVRVDVFGRLMCQVWNTNTNSWQTLMAPINRPVPVGEPFLVTAVIDGRNSLLLLNGEVVAAGEQDYESITNGFTMTIGAHHYNDNYNEARYQYHMRGDIHWLKIGQFPHN